MRREKMGDRIKKRKGKKQEELRDRYVSCSLTVPVTVPEFLIKDPPTYTLRVAA